MADKTNMTEWQPRAKRIAKIIAAVATAVLAVLASLGLTGCARAVEEHIEATPDGITFSRSVGSRASTGGFVLSRDSLRMNPVR